jgi:hypothetical protein
MRSMARMSPVGFLVNLYAPWEVPMAMASVRAVAVLLVALHRLERPQAAQLALDRDAEAVRHVHDLLRDVHVVVVGGDGLAVGLEGAVHHDAGEAQLDGAFAHRGGLAVVLVHRDRRAGIGLHGRLDQVLEESLAGVFPRPGGGLHDHGAVGLGGGLHDRLDLLQVVHVERGKSVAVFGCVVQQLPHRYECHGSSSGRCG